MQAMKTPEARTAATHDVVGHAPFGTPRVCATALDAKASASAAVRMRTMRKDQRRSPSRARAACSCDRAAGRMIGQGRDDTAVKVAAELQQVRPAVDGHVNVAGLDRNDACAHGAHVTGPSSDVFDERAQLGLVHVPLRETSKTRVPPFLLI
jgi:hypothetical protein